MPDIGHVFKRNCSEEGVGGIIWTNIRRMPASDMADIGDVLKRSCSWRDELTDEALGVDPTEPVIADAELASSETMTAWLSRPAASIAPHSAASLVARTGSGVTLSSAMPSARRPSIHCSGEEKTKRSMAGELVDDVVRQIGVGHM
jgi:hypothetical protein